LPLILQVLGIEDRGSEIGRLSRQDQALLDQLLGDFARDQPAPPPSDASEGSEQMSHASVNADKEDRDDQV